MVELTKTALPKAKGGRKAAPLDEGLLKALTDALKSEPLDGERPAAYGPATNFDTEGKAGGQARRYATALSLVLENKVRVNIYPTNAPEDGKPSKPPYRWRVYIPLASQK